jgi:acyl dehydratase
MGSIGPTPRRSRIVNEATINMADKSPRYAEDYRVGEVFDLGQIVITRDEIIEFSKMWDPQPFHVDERNAGTSAYGGLVASGWHVTLLMMRMMNDSGFISHETSLGSPGHDGLKWLKPELSFVTHIAKLQNDAKEDVYVLMSTSIVKTRSGKAT